LTIADYARVMPLVTGDVKPDGIDLTLIHTRRAPVSERMRAEIEPLATVVHAERPQVAGVSPAPLRTSVARVIAQ